MKVIFAAAATVSMLALAPAARAQATAFQCIASSVGPGGSNVVIYVSQMISGDTSQRATLTAAWGAYVKGAYRLETLASTVCSPFGTDPAVQQRVLTAEQNAWQKKGMNIVQVNWTPGQNQNAKQNSNTNPYATAAPPADAGSKDPPAADAKDDAKNAAPPADAGRQPRSSYCYSDDKKPTIYFSDAFDTVDLTSPKAWSIAFLKFLVQKYSYKGTVICKDSDTIFNAQSAIRDQKDALAGKETIDTDWTYQPPAPGDPAAVADAPADTPAPKKSTHASH
jgi:hypothetical protein